MTKLSSVGWGKQLHLQVNGRQTSFLESDCDEGSFSRGEISLSVGKSETLLEAFRKSFRWKLKRISPTLLFRWVALNSIRVCYTNLKIGISS